MAIKLPQGFKITGTEPIDSRLVLTKAEMASAVATKMPDKYICVCKEDGHLYIYMKDLSQSQLRDSETGNFVPYEDILDLPKAIADTMATEEGKEAMEDALKDAIPGSIAKAMAEEGGAEEVLDSMFNTEHFQTTLDNKIDISISLIQAIDSN